MNNTENRMERIRPLIRKYGIVALAVMRTHNGECCEEDCEKILDQFRQFRNKTLRNCDEKNKEE